VRRALWVKTLGSDEARWNGGARVKEGGVEGTRRDKREGVIYFYSREVEIYGVFMGEVVRLMHRIIRGNV